MTSKNLEPGQYQIGDFVFGTWTNFNVEAFDIAGWEVTTQDQQTQLADEISMGSDSFKPAPIHIELTASRNRMLPNVVAMLDNPDALNFDNDRRIGDFTKEWRADEVRKEWGKLKPLYVCRPDGSTVMVYGRPGKLAVSREMPNSLTRKVVAEFRRADTLAYNEFEWYLQTRLGEKPIVHRTSRLGHGDGPAWFRLILIGPMEHPIINVGDLTVELDYELEPGDVVEISGYPWQRRCIRLNDGMNLAAYLVRPYLNKLRFDVDKPYELAWNATNANVQVEERDFSAYTNTAEGLPAADWFPTVYSPGAGTYRLLNGVLTWVDSGNNARVGVSIFKQPTVSSYQLVGMKIPTPGEIGVLGNPEPANRVIGKSNPEGTRYLYWEVGISHIWYGYHQDGVDYRLSPAYPLDTYVNIFWRILGEFFNDLFGVSTNWEYEAEFGTGASGMGSTIRINGVHTQSFDPVDFTGFNMSDENRYTGIGMKATSRGLGQSTPGTASKFWMRDNDPAQEQVSSVIMLWRDAWQNI